MLRSAGDSAGRLAGRAEVGRDGPPSAGADDRSPSALDDAAREQLRTAIVSETRAAWVAAAVPFAMWIVLLRHPALPAFGIAIAALNVVRLRAACEVDDGRVERAVVLFMASKWAVSLLLVTLLPLALPIVVVNLVMPIALAAMHLTARHFLPMLAAAVGVAFAAGVIGYQTNWLDLEDEFTPWVWSWGCVVILAIHFVPLSLILWRGNRTQAITYGEAVESNARLRESEADLRDSRRRLVEVADAERSKLERDLHDGAQQRLVGVLMRLRLAERAGARGEAADREPLLDELEAAIGELRELAHGIYPPALTASGPVGALREVARRSGADVRVASDGIERHDAAPEAAIYFCCVEAVQNAVKHGGHGVVVEVSLDERDGCIAGRVVDDGPGFEPLPASRPGGGVGLQNMADRIGAVGGELRVGRSEAGGTVVAFTVPCPLHVGAASREPEGVPA